MLFTIGVLLFWILLTIWVQFGGKQDSVTIKALPEHGRALVIYNPDPIYNLDKQVCNSLARGLSHSGLTTTVSTVKYVDTNDSKYDLIVFCANTYNWQPDWAIQKFIRSFPNLESISTASITLGAGSTQNASNKMEKLLRSRNSSVLVSRNLWLMKPNDETQPDIKNVERANQIATDIGKHLSRLLSD